MGVELNGMSELDKMIKKLQAVGSSIKGCNLNPVNRSENGDDNPAIIGKLKDQDRDFAAIDKVEAERIAKAFARKAEVLLEQSVDAPPTVVAAKSVIEAMREYMRIVIEHIKEGKIENKQLSPSYADYKSRQPGWSVYPIGIATGQLLDNLNPDEIKNIRPIISKNR